MRKIIIDQSEIFELSVIDLNGDFVTGLTISYEVRNSSDNTLIINGTLTEQDEVYKFSHTFDTLGQYRIKYITPTSYPNSVESITIINDTDSKVTQLLSDVDDIKERMISIAALLHDNSEIVNFTHDSGGNLLTATVRGYANPTDLANQTNVIREYKLTATYDGDQLTSSFKLSRII